MVVRYLNGKVIFAMCLLASTQALAASPSMPRTANIVETKHNLSAQSTNSTKATSEDQICAFCHTPHQANSEATSLRAPLWNRNLSQQTYVPYDSSSLQAPIDSNPGGASKLCLSCHDGTIAIGNLNVLEGQPNVAVAMTNATMPAGGGTTSGFTRNLGIDLTGDHPISFSFDTSKLGQPLPSVDNELRDPQTADGAHIAQPSSGFKPALPLDHENKVQCTTCHDPHVSGEDLPTGTTAGASGSNNAKFLRGRRFQMTPPLGGSYDESNDIICLGCHDKDGQTWSSSSHASNSTADELYKVAASDQREFPQGIQVWQAACLNCHDTHTVQGANRLLREATDSTASPKTGGNAAQEETCFQCHGNTSILAAGSQAPNIEAEFNKTRRMPLRDYEQPAGSERHDIKNADFTENRGRLGYNSNLNNRHVECTDCHNPHRMISNSLADGSGLLGQSTHEHSAGHSNKVSGALKGTWGVEPVYDIGTNGRKFGTAAGMPIGFNVKKGTGANKVEFEYQICLKCHSNYAYSDNGLHESATRPARGGIGLTPKSGITNFNYYTNQAMEFQAPSNHQGEPLSVGTDGGAELNANNHRSWHPVMAATGRSASDRNASANSWLPPWNGGVGTQTMYCTDCHGASNGTATNSAPPVGVPWGPHGSDNDFILRGSWGTMDPQTLCFKCHDKNAYQSGDTGFQGGGEGDLHDFHTGAIDSYQSSKGLGCYWCHTAVPHGWKNKALLVNLNDVGPEADCSGSPCAPGTNKSGRFTNLPYYYNAYLKISSWGQSGSWRASDCGGRDTMRNSCEDAQY